MDKTEGKNPADVILNKGQDDEMTLQGYTLVYWRKILTWTCIILTLGFLRLVFFWKPDWFLRSTHRPCELQVAQKVLLRNKYKQVFVEVVQTSQDGAEEPFFINKKIKYVWRKEGNYFGRLRGFEVDHNCSYFHECSGLTEEERKPMNLLFGSNNIVVRVTPVVKVLFTQALNPFYVFQVFSCTVWYVDEYYYYATTIIIVSIVSLTIEIYVTRSMQRALKRTINTFDVVNVYRPQQGFIKENSDVLVPGDVIEIPRFGFNIPCDAVLITGSCIVDESMLTGESIPVTKTSLPNPKKLNQDLDTEFSLKHHSRHVLFCGTKVVQARYYSKEYVKAVVLRTGFYTAKGDLVRSILFPKPTDFQFSQDSFKFIGVLAVIALFGMGYTYWKMISRGSPIGDIIIRSLDLVTITVPPALPAALTVGVVAAQFRLKKNGIFCISTNNINQSGALNITCFDKTGTLTEDGLDLHGVVTLNDEDKEGCHLNEVVFDCTNLEHDHFLFTMTTCHSLTRVENEMCGDPLDMKMFQATGWEFEEPEEDTSRFETFLLSVVRPAQTHVPSVVTQDLPECQQNLGLELGVLRQFTFSSNLQRMSVIASRLGQKTFNLYVKGSPEMIASLCNPTSLPLGFDKRLSFFTAQGFRVIALAWRPLTSMNYVKIQRVEREELEQNLTFLGFVVMENRLKPQTKPVIQELHAAAIRTIMVTGDNLLTAISVAYECTMLKSGVPVEILKITNSSSEKMQLNYTTHKSEQDASKAVRGQVKLEMPAVSSAVPVALTGLEWEKLYTSGQQHLPDVLSRGVVFARMSPEQKQQLVEQLQKKGYYVGMCGDGANDCGALKTANAGVSLSEAEASVAAPFTSKDPTIRCMPRVMKEGRAALTTAFGIFKYMACFSMTQFLLVCLLYWEGANMTDFGFLWHDLFINMSLFVTFCFTDSCDYLVPQPPDVSLISLRPILSIILQTAIVLGAQVGIWFLTVTQPWYVPYDIVEDDYQVHIVTTLQLVSFFQVTYLAVVFAQGPPYRRPAYTNYRFLVNVLILTAINIKMTIYPMKWFADFMELEMPPSYIFRGILLGIALGNFILAYMLEDFIIDSKWMRKQASGKHQRDQLNCFGEDNMGYEKFEQDKSISGFDINDNVKGTTYRTLDQTQL